MDRYPRLTRTQLIAALRAHARAHRFVSTASLHAHDPIALRSLPLHFVGINAARQAAKVPGPPYQKPRKKTGPKAGTIAGRRTKKWSRERVLDELRRLYRSGVRLTPADITNAGHSSLIRAAVEHVGGLRRARELAELPSPARRIATKRWSEQEIIAAIRTRARRRLPLAAPQVPQGLVSAARWRFGTWRAALEAVGIDPEVARVRRATKYTRQAIIDILRREVRAGSELRAVQLAKVLKLEFVRREFGTLRGAISAAGLEHVLESRKHGLQKWTRERVIETLTARARRGEYGLTPGLNRVVQLYFGGAEAARKAAGVPSPAEARARAAELARRPLNNGTRRRPVRRPSSY